MADCEMLDPKLGKSGVSVRGTSGVRPESVDNMRTLTMQGRLSVEVWMPNIGE